MLDIDVYPVTPKISKINWSDFVLVHSWSEFYTCSNCCSWLLESLLLYAQAITTIMATLSFLVAMKNQFRLVLCIHNIHA